MENNSLVKFENESFLPAINQPGGELMPPPAATVQTLESFNQLLNTQPDAKEVATNPFSDNAKYLPISFVQMLLDEMFIGLWETKNFQYKVVANEMIGSVTLRYYHPFAKVWLEREGAAAVMIQQKKGSDITDIGAKIKNTLAKDHPHLLASCIMNAARSIGKAFGRDLNRKLEDNYTSFYSDIAASESITGAIDWDMVTTRAQLAEIWKANPTMQTNKQFLKTFQYQSGRIKK
ncbi:MAG: hypothetical protein ABIU30_18435 [Ferruginibacter sp.]